MAEKLLIIGLDSAPPELVFDRFRDELPVLSRLMSEGAWGALESIIPPITCPAWMSMMSSKHPGQLGFYGFRNRRSYSYDDLYFANSTAVKEELLWEMLGRHGLRTIIVGVPQTYPPKPVNGCMVTSFLTPSIESDYTYPRELRDEIESLVGEYMLDVANFRTDDKDYLLGQIYEMTKKRFAVVRHLMEKKPWDFLMMVEMGTDRIHHGFWKQFDEKHVKHDPDSPYKDAIRDYYRYVDSEIGGLLERVDEETGVLVVSDHGAKRMDGGICFNEWLMQEGYLTLHEPLEVQTPLKYDMIDWKRTVAWGEGGYYGRLFLNVRGREPEGVVRPEDYEDVRSELVEKLESLPDQAGAPIGTRAYRPEELYPVCNGVPPDLIVIFGDLFWRSVGSVGMGVIHTTTNDTGPDDANHSQHGIFILRHRQVSGRGEVEGAHLLDIAPTLLQLMGLDVPVDMAGRPLFDGAG